MIARALFRNPFRSSVSVVTGLVATALLYATVNNYSAIGYLIDYEYRRVSHEEYTLSLRDPVRSTASPRSPGCPA